jgi:GT2 family glycosyltransferase
MDNSKGGIDDCLGSFKSHNVTIIKNDENIGKAESFTQHYRKIMRKFKIDHFISIDSDVEVPPYWLLKLKIAMYRIRRIQPFGILAPHINNKFGPARMHKISETTTEVLPSIYYNRYTAGPVFLIDRNFFEDTSGYRGPLSRRTRSQNQLYGNDDGKLCHAAAQKNLFVGFTSNVEVLHLEQNLDKGYIKWKHQNIQGNISDKGYWD